MTNHTKQAIEALRRLLDVSMVAMTDKDLATEETVAAWDAASEVIAAYEAAQQAGEQALPPLPIEWRKVEDADGIQVPVFRAFQMWDYARAAQAAQPLLADVPSAMQTVTAAMKADPGYAWSWHCNVAMSFVDAGGDHYTANQGAAKFMQLLAGVEPAHELPAQPAPEAQQAAMRSDGMPASAAERHLRRLLAVRVGMPHTYFDDGEAQGQEHGVEIDFMREPVADIDAKLRALNVARHESAKPESPQPAQAVPLSEIQAERLYANIPPSAQQDARSREAFKRLVKVVESAHGIGVKLAGGGEGV